MKQDEEYGNRVQGGRRGVEKDEQFMNEWDGKVSGIILSSTNGKIFKDRDI